MHRTLRCTKHGIAVGLCEAPGCEGSDDARNIGRQLVAKIKLLKCSLCPDRHAGVRRRGPFYGTTPRHPGFQNAFCDTCWERRLEREAAAQSRRTAPQRQPTIGDD